MGLQPNAGDLVPDWVYADYFPQADETLMGTLAQAWGRQADACTGKVEGIGRAMTTLSDTYAGPAAVAAEEHVLRARQWTTSVGDHCTKISQQVEQAAGYVRFTKTAINLVLVALQLATQRAQESSSGLIDKVIVLMQIRQMQIAAQAQVRALSEACATKIGSLTVPVDINPTLTEPSTGAKTAYGVTTSTVAYQHQAHGGGTGPTANPAAAMTGGGAVPTGLPGDSADDGQVVDDPTAFMGGGPSAAGPGGPVPTGPLGPDGASADGDASNLLDGDGSNPFDPSAQQTMDHSTFDYDADDLAADSANVDPNAAADTLTGPGAGDHGGRGPGSGGPPSTEDLTGAGFTSDDDLPDDDQPHEDQPYENQPHEDQPDDDQPGGADPVSDTVTGDSRDPLGPSGSCFTADPSRSQPAPQTSQPAYTVSPSPPQPSYDQPSYDQPSGGSHGSAAQDAGGDGPASSGGGSHVSGQGGSPAGGGPMHSEPVGTQARVSPRHRNRCRPSRPPTRRGASRPLRPRPAVRAAASAADQLPRRLRQHR